MPGWDFFFFWRRAGGMFFKEDIQMQEEGKYVKLILRIDVRACLNRVYTQCTS